MPDYIATFFYKDALNGETTRSFKGTFTDNASAQTALSALQTDLIAATKSKIWKRSLNEVTLISGAVNANTLVFNTVSATVELVGKADKANLNFPDPVDAMMTGNALDITATEWTDLVANFATGAGWTISDGDEYSATVSGERVIVRSGKTNLPA